MSTLSDESEPFVIINKTGTKIDATDELNDDEMDEIYQLVCIKRIKQLNKLIVPSCILFYYFMSVFYIIPHLGFTFQNLILFNIFILFLVINLLISYLKTSLSHPGRIPLIWLLWNGELNNIPSFPIYCSIMNCNINNDKLINAMYCKWCKKHRPFRSGHCSQCDECIAFMDHHCDFVQNCIGTYNHRWFIQFILYLFIVLNIYIFYVNQIWNLDNIKFLVFIKILFICGILLQIWLIVRLIIPQFKNLFNNRTYIEVKYAVPWIDNHKRSYGLYDKLSIVLGTSIIGWFIPTEWTKYDLKQRLIDNSYTYDLLNGDVLLKDAIYAFRRDKKDTNSMT